MCSQEIKVKNRAATSRKLCHKEADSTEYEPRGFCLSYLSICYVFGSIGHGHDCSKCVPVWYLRVIICHSASALSKRGAWETMWASSPVMFLSCCRCPSLRAAASGSKQTGINSAYWPWPPASCTVVGLAGTRHRPPPQLQFPSCELLPPF